MDKNNPTEKQIRVILNHAVARKLTEECKVYLYKL